VSLTPLDINHKEFRRSLRGLRESDVKDFLREVADEMEQALATIADLRGKAQSLERRLLHYEKIEETMQNALVLAQKSAEETRLGSQKQAEVILADAEQKRKQILEDARLRGEDIERQHAELKQQKRMFEMEFRALLQAHTEALDRRAEGEPVEAPRLLTEAEEELPAELVDDETPKEEEAPLNVLDWTRVRPDEGEPEQEETEEPEYGRHTPLAAVGFGGTS